MEFTIEQLDALKEIANIGAGNAAAALSQLLDKKVLIDIPQIKLVSTEAFEKIEFLPKTDCQSVEVFHKILGQLQGGMLVMFPEQSACAMIDVLKTRSAGSTQSFSSTDESVINESSHILCSSYLNAIREILGLQQLIPSIAQTYTGKLSKLATVIAEKFTQGPEYVLPIENHLIIENIEFSLFVMFLLKSESLQGILEILKV